MTKLTQETEQSGYSLGGLNQQYIESIENEFIELLVTVNKKDKKTS